MDFRSMSGRESEEEASALPRGLPNRLGTRTYPGQNGTPVLAYQGTVTVMSGRFITTRPCIHMPALPMSAVRKVISHSMLNSFNLLS